mgnify:CR=1 FL=1
MSIAPGQERKERWRKDLLKVDLSKPLCLSAYYGISSFCNVMPVMDKMNAHDGNVMMI